MSASASTPSTSKTAVFALGGAALVGVGVAAGMWLNRPSTTATEVPTAASAPTVMVASTASAPQMSQIASGPANQPVATVSTQAPAPTQAAEAKPAPRKVVKTKPHTDTQAGQATPASPAPVAICATCGTVDHVRTIQKEVASTGVGAVAGGVLGGVIGNQLGKGQGKTAMTILGAIGGGVAGNEIEKKQRSETAYEITIRMDDGTTRTVTQNTPATVGSRVEVNGQQVSNLD
ncbi:MAG: glycine zipper 2TM domain-containing protein [Aquabacterium sp.]